MMAGPDAGERPERRWLAGVASGVSYLVLGPAAGLATACIATSPPLLIDAVAGVALLGALTSALAAATADPDRRDAALGTFVVTASQVTALGISSPFWGLVARLAFLGVQRARTS
ncbi:MAG: benzoate/H(+) symporter BenE family transporter [Solirubrobacterales bacterium]|nr:benzoate/H(+) symporter BenE family transporter [Solirubrobacterales bacterium]